MGYRTTPELLLIGQVHRNTNHKQNVIPVIDVCMYSAITSHILNTAPPKWSVSAETEQIFST